MTYPTLRDAVVAVLCLVLLSACAPTVGGPSTLRDMGRYLTLVPGQSTNGDVYSSFGQPYDVLPADGGSRWVYYYLVERTSGWTYVPFAGCLAGGSNLDTTITTFAFDGAERLLRFEMHEAAHVQKYVGAGG